MRIFYRVTSVLLTTEQDLAILSSNVACLFQCLFAEADSVTAAKPSVTRVNLTGGRVQLKQRWRQPSSSSTPLWRDVTARWRQRRTFLKASSTCAWHNTSLIVIAILNSYLSLFTYNALKVDSDIVTPKRSLNYTNDIIYIIKNDCVLFP